MLTDIELIRKIEFFEALDPKILKQIAEMCIVREFSAGEYIVRQGESGLGLYFITSGRAKVEIVREETKVVVAELKSGDFLGEFSIIDEKARSANVICTEETRCLLLTRDSFSKVMRKHPEIANQMLRTLVGRIRSTNERISVANTSSQPSAPAAAAAPAPAAASADAPAATAADESMTAQEGLIDKLSGYLPPMPSISDIPHPSEVFKLYTSTKTKTREYLNEMIGTIYAMKAMMRFSMAIVGCPVRVSAESGNPDVLAAEINGVKLLLFPAGKEETLRVEAYDDGVMRATIYQPAADGAGASVRISELAGPVARDAVYRLRVPAAGAVAIESPEGLETSWGHRHSTIGR